MKGVKGMEGNPRARGHRKTHADEVTLLDENCNDPCGFILSDITVCVCFVISSLTAIPSACQLFLVRHKS